MSVSIRGRLETIVSKAEPHYPFRMEHLKAIAEDLHARGIIKCDSASLDGRLEAATYIARNLFTHVAIALATLPGVVPGITDVASSIGKESWSVSSLLYEAKNRNWGNAAVHLTVIPFCWIPRVGGLSYLLPMSAKDPEAALVHAYALSKLATAVVTTAVTFAATLNTKTRTFSKNPEELCEWLGSLPPSRVLVWAYDASRAHYFFDTLGAALKYAGYPVDFVRERTTVPLHRFLQHYPSYAVLDWLAQNVVYTPQLVFGKVIAPSFVRGARS